MNTLLAITGRVPYSTTEEAFVQDELETMMRRGVDLIVVPARTQTAGPNPASVDSGLADRVLAEPVVSLTVVRGAVRTLLRRPGRSIRVVVRALAGSGSLRNFVANLSTVPKALWLADIARSREVTHVHGYWFAHPATMAMICGDIMGLPWSATGFRWDIDADNAMAQKIESAAFLRVADELGARQMAEKVASSTRPACPVPLVRTGVAVPERSTWEANPLGSDLICCPGAFVEKKGHLLLLEAVAARVAAGQDLQVHLFGDGPERGRIEAAIERHDLGGRVVLHGIVPLDELRAFLGRRRPVVVLPSIKADDGQEEGIPVVLIEAMANGAPVISTRTGSIPTLVTTGCGWLVQDRDAAALATAIADATQDTDETEAVCARAAERVSREFDREATAETMATLTGVAQTSGAS
ncbi:glycosyltransferase [Nocardioides currus]|uniref:Glycosyl transferase family 1 domain-containing protein n=1 Tax=Nocardioides currus TaxID=2133958 RepID=A0A2R7Z356_9ACTN|nr:glycosyltransferase [Nocardioides currus]PUA83022.1 hypothetical protein C7S10_04910 [Nocardioides currus]